MSHSNPFNIPVAEIFEVIEGHIAAGLSPEVVAIWQGHRSALEAFQRGEIRHQDTPAALRHMGWVMPSWGYGRG